MTTEWYRFFWNIYGFTGSGVVPVNKGGTGLDTIGNHQIIIGNTNNVFEPALLSSASITITYPAGFVNLELGTSGVTAGTYGSASQVGVFTVNAYGVLTAASNTSIGIDASQIISGTIASARISGSYTGITGVGTLTAGTWNASTIGAGYGGTGQSTYAVGDMLYATGTTALSKLAIGTSTYILASSGTAPQWVAPSSIAIGTATNLAGGLANQIPYQTGPGATTFMVAPTTANTYLEWSGTAFQWSNNPLGTVTSVSVVSANGFAGTVATATTTPAITLTTTITGLLKGNGTAISAATSGTDYAPATSGTSILYGNGAGGFSNVTIGTGVSFVGGTLSATGSGGTVTSVTGTSPVVSSGGTTPAISLATAYGDTLNPYASKTANYFLAAPNGSAGVPTFRAMVAADVPALAYVTSVSGTGSVNGITLTGTVTSSGSLTLGGTLSGIGNSQLTNSTISGVALGGNLFSLTAGTGVSFSSGTTYNGSAAITINATGTGGTVTSVAALTLGTTGTDLSSTVANSTTTPVITLNVPTASAANRGALSAADWTTFNSKAPGVTFTTGYVPFGQGTTTLNQSTNFTFDGSNLVNTGSHTAASFIPSSSTVPTNGMYLPTTNTLGWATNSTSRMILDAIGILGLGVTPSSWGTTFSQKAIQVSTSGTFSALDAGAGNVQLNIGNNAYDFGIGAKYVTTNSAAAYKMVGRQHQWLSAASGTAGTAISFTQAMTLFAGGGLALGSTSDPGNTNAYIEGTLKTGGAITAGGTAGDVLFGKYSNSFPSSGVGYFKLATNNTDGFNGGLSISTLSAGTLTEKVRIFTSGGVSIGNTTDKGASSLNVSGLIYPQQAATASAPAYVKGAIYFDTTLNKLRVGGATAWETITSVQDKL